MQDGLTDAEGYSYRMAGVIPSESRWYRGELVRFGYATIEAEQDGAFLKKGEQIRAHEFHHWDSTDNGDSCLAVKPDGKRRWQCIHMKGNLMAGCPHLYYQLAPGTGGTICESLHRIFQKRNQTIKEANYDIRRITRRDTAG